MRLRTTTCLFSSPSICFFLVSLHCSSYFWILHFHRLLLENLIQRSAHCLWFYKPFPHWQSKVSWYSGALTCDLCILKLFFSLLWKFHFFQHILVNLHKLFFKPTEKQPNASSRFSLPLVCSKKILSLLFLKQGIGKKKDQKYKNKTFVPKSQSFKAPSLVSKQFSSFISLSTKRS